MLKQQYLVQDQIKLIEEMLYNSELISPKDEESSTIRIGSTVIFVEMPSGDEEKVIIK